MALLYTFPEVLLLRLQLQYESQVLTWPKIYVVLLLCVFPNHSERAKLMNLVQYSKKCHAELEKKKKKPSKTNNNNKFAEEKNLRIHNPDTQRLCYKHRVKSEIQEDSTTSLILSDVVSQTRQHFAPALTKVIHNTNVCCSQH